MLQGEMDRIKNVLDQMNQVKTDDVAHLAKAKKLKNRVHHLITRHKVAVARVEQSQADMKQLAEHRANAPPEARVAQGQAIMQRLESQLAQLRANKPPQASSEKVPVDAAA